MVIFIKVPTCTPRAAIGAAFSTTACVTTKQTLVCAKAMPDVGTALHRSLFCGMG
ncbi:hypothetical protein [Candidatus Sarmatiella mevalonica]|uniref:hypothetical protein n=1 Tax=Candidatus Sarmatiella mevalonica TaxID=2770581 RepID=UPI0019210A26|nr:hypothetical protein [Candidatus Sarmatiella mevalonica]